MHAHGFYDRLAQALSDKGQIRSMVTRAHVTRHLEHRPLLRQLLPAHERVLPPARNAKFTGLAQLCKLTRNCASLTRNPREGQDVAQNLGQHRQFRAPGPPPGGRMVLGDKRQSRPRVTRAHAPRHGGGGGPDLGEAGEVAGPVEGRLPGPGTAVSIARPVKSAIERRFTLEDAEGA